VAIDVDPDAVSAAQVNAGRNGCAGLTVRLAEPQEVRERFPLVLANLLTHTHLALASEYARLVAPGGSLVLGGMLDHEDEHVSQTLAGAGFTPRSRLALDGWASRAEAPPVTRFLPWRTRSAARVTFEAAPPRRPRVRATVGTW
jgi:ribosomal protein L11 methyltransferase